METKLHSKAKLQHSEIYKFHKELELENGVLKFYIGLYNPCKTETHYIRSDEYLIQVYKLNFWGELEWHGTIHASEQDATLIITKKCLTIESIIRIVKDNIYEVNQETENTQQDGII